MLEGRLALLQFASATSPPAPPPPHCICSKCHSAFSRWFLLGSVEPQLFKLTSYLPAALFLLLCSPVMSQPSQNREEINDSLRTEASATPRPLLPRAHPTWLRVILSHQALPTPHPRPHTHPPHSHPFSPYRKTPNTSLSIRAYYRAPMLARQRKTASAAQECVQERLGELNEEP